MYKTVRHGENSLQYTILPQTEEVLNNSGMKGKGRDYSPSIHVRRSERRSAVNKVMMLAFGLVVAMLLGTVLVCIIDEAVSKHHNAAEYDELPTAPPLPSTSRQILKSRKKALMMSANRMLSPTPSAAPITSTSTQTTSTSFVTVTLTSIKTPMTTVTRDRLTTPPWTMPALRSWKSSTSSTAKPQVVPDRIEQSTFLGTPSGSIRLLDHYMSIKPWDKDIIIIPTVTPETITIRDIFKYYSRANSATSEKSVPSSKVFEDVLITTKESATKPPVTTELATTSAKPSLSDLKDTLLSVDDDDDFKESLEVDEVFSLPPLKPEWTGPRQDNDEVTVSKADDGWYGARWPFVDTSSYFQWKGYSRGDNLLLPLLVSALSSIALVLLLAVAVRRRKRTHVTSAHIGTLTSDLQADDNTNLLEDTPEEIED